MTILIFGKTGQVATELQRKRRNVIALGRDQANLQNPDACAAAIRQHRPSAVINAAAYTNVDAAETDEANATVINAASPAAIANACAEAGIPVVQISTDYVFDGGSTEAFRTDSTPSPCNAYGRSKLSGEIAVRENASTHAVLRTSWVFSPHGKNFLKTMLQLGTSHSNLRIVCDQIGGPTPASAIASACIGIVDRLIEDPFLSGTYHLSGAPNVSWADFAREILKQARIDCSVTGIPTADYPTPAQRPMNSRLDCSSLSQLGLKQPDWQAGIHDALTELGVIS